MFKIKQRETTNSVYSGVSTHQVVLFFIERSSTPFLYWWIQHATPKGECGTLMSVFLNDIDIFIINKYISYKEFL